MPKLPKPIHLLVFDFDGVLTDNRVWVFEDGHEAVACSRGDGMGIGMVMQKGLPVLVLSKEKNPVVSARCKKLKVECIQGIDDKPTELKRLCTERGYDLKRVVYMGNDINDLECMKLVGYAVAPADAEKSILKIAHLVTKRKGGRGAARDLCDLILETRL